jgi:hypothetical protein
LQKERSSAVVGDGIKMEVGVGEKRPLIPQFRLFKKIGVSLFLGCITLHANQLPQADLPLAILLKCAKELIQSGGKSAEDPRGPLEAVRSGLPAKVLALADQIESESELQILNRLFRSETIQKLTVTELKDHRGFAEYAKAKAWLLDFPNTLHANQATFADKLIYQLLREIQLAKLGRSNIITIDLANDLQSLLTRQRDLNYHLLRKFILGRLFFHSEEAAADLEGVWSSINVEASSVKNEIRIDWEAEPSKIIIYKAQLETLIRDLRAEESYEALDFLIGCFVGLFSAHEQAMLSELAHEIPFTPPGITAALEAPPAPPVTDSLQPHQALANARAKLRAFTALMDFLNWHNKIEPLRSNLDPVRRLITESFSVASRIYGTTIDTSKFNLFGTWVISVFRLFTPKANPVIVAITDPMASSLYLPLDRGYKGKTIALLLGALNSTHKQLSEQPSP